MVYFVIHCVLDRWLQVICYNTAAARLVDAQDATLFLTLEDAQMFAYPKDTIYAFIVR